MMRVCLQTMRHFSGFSAKLISIRFLLADTSQGTRVPYPQTLRGQDARRPFKIPGRVE
jgi:hypothetical protein